MCDGTRGVESLQDGSSSLSVLDMVFPCFFHGDLTVGVGGRADRKSQRGSDLGRNEGRREEVAGGGGGCWFVTR